MSKSPCYGCERRQVGCHNVETYEAWREHMERKERRMAAEQRQRELGDYKVRSMGRFRKLNER